MALPWVRLDTSLPHNPKILGLVEDKRWQALSVYTFGLAYSGAHGLDGFLPAACIGVIHGNKRVADELIGAGLWMPRPGGWTINGWAEFQMTSEEHENRRKKAQAAAEVRWAKSRQNGGGHA